MSLKESPRVVVFTIEPKYFLERRLGDPVAASFCVTEVLPKHQRPIFLTAASTDT
jgi:hypothetical protein